MRQRPDETSQIEASLRDLVETTTNGTRPFGKRAERYARGVWDWGIKRGILFMLTQMPMIAFLVGIAFKWMGYPLITVFTVIAAFLALPIWVSDRRDRSDDPGEPAHHFVKLAMWALVPYVVYNIARVPAYYLLKVVFWDHWYAFGSTLTGEPPDHWASLLSGTFIHSLQGYVLVLGYYVLFGRGTLRSALLYIFVFLSAIYSSVFPLFILIDFKPGPAWYFMVWWAHFWMALAVYAVPRLYAPGLWRRLRGRVTRPGVIALLILVYFSPILFVFWRAATWQFPIQYTIDRALFQRTRMGLKEDAVLTAKSPSAPEEVLYQMRLRVGPRIYQDYIKATKALDVQGLRISGRLLHRGEPVASCFAHVTALESPKTILVPSKYRAAVQRMDFTDVPVDCVGSAAVADRLQVGSEVVTVEVRWTAVATLIGDRNRKQRTFGGVGVRDIISGTFEPSLLRPDPAIESRGRIIF